MELLYCEFVENQKAGGGVDEDLTEQDGPVTCRSDEVGRKE